MRLCKQCFTYRTPADFVMLNLVRKDTSKVWHRRFRWMVQEGKEQTICGRLV